MKLNLAALRRLLFISAVNAILIAGVLATAEYYARRHQNAVVQEWGDEALAMCIPDDRRIWRYRAGVDFSYRKPDFTMRIRTNADGLRSDTSDLSGDGPSILFIGDSFTFGWGVDERDRFSEEIAENVAAKLGKRVRFVNAGYWMYTFDQQLLVLKEQLTRFRPQVVVQGLYWPHLRTLFNHELDYIDGALTRVGHSGLKVDEHGVLRFRSDWLDRPPLNSQLIALTARYFLNADLVRSAKEIDPFMRPNASADTERLWNLAEVILRETAVTVRAAGAVYVPLYIPLNAELAEQFWQTSFQQDPPANIDANLPKERLQAILAAAGATLIDPSPTMQEIGAERLYFKSDPHWNAEGHRTIGKLLTPVVFNALKNEK
jgi:hypothetical protein